MHLKKSNLTTRKLTRKLQKFNIFFRKCLHIRELTRNSIYLNIWQILRKYPVESQACKLTRDKVQNALNILNASTFQGSPCRLGDVKESGKENQAEWWKNILSKSLEIVSVSFNVNPDIALTIPFLIFFNAYFTDFQN